MKRKNILITLSALCVSALLCMSPAVLFAVTDTALFSGTYTQNARRGSIDVTGDDVYLARVLREPGEYVYVESNAAPEVYAETVIEKLKDFTEAGLIGEELEQQLEQIVYFCLDAQSIWCTITTTDITTYTGYDIWGYFSVNVENMTGKVMEASYSFYDTFDLHLPGASGVEEVRTFLDAYLAYLGFDVFGDWEYYSYLPPEVMENDGCFEVHGFSETGGVNVWLSAGGNYLTFGVSGGAEVENGMTPLE